MSQRILIVENSPEYRQMLQEIVQALGFEVEAVDRALEAWRVMERDPVALLLLDIKMPGVRGDDFLRFIRKKGRRTPVIVISGYLTPQVMENLLQHQVGVIAKPFRVKRLALDISKALEAVPAETSSRP